MIFVSRFQPKTNSYRLPYQCRVSSADCAESCSRAQTDRPVCTSQKNFWVGGCRFLWVTSKVK